MIDIYSSAKRLFVACAFAIAPLSPHAAVLYGVTGAGFSPSSLYTINLQTDTATLIGPTGLSHVTGIDFDPTTGILYGWHNDGLGLVRINTSTGTATAVGLPSNFQIPDIAFGPDGVLRGWVEFVGLATFDDLVLIDKNTGALTVTSSSLRTGGTGIAWGSPTTVLVKTGQTLPSTFFSVDVATGAIGNSFNVSVNSNNLLDNAPDGGLLFGDRIGTSFGSTTFFSVNTDGSGLTNLGTVQTPFSGIAFSIDATAIPEPGSLALVGLAVSAFGIARRRNKE